MRTRLGTAVLLLTLALIPTLTISAEAVEEEHPKSTTFSADLTGLWWVPAESGWGLNIVQQSEVLFLTFFVYGTDSRPTWLVGSDVEYSGSDASGNFVFTGALYQTSGPWFGGFFNPNAVGVTQVGTVTLRFSGYGTGQVTYTVNGLSVTKNIVPQTWRTNNLAGTYLGAVYGAAASCSLPITATGALLAFNVTQSGSIASLTIATQNGNNCIFSGTTTEVGKLINIDGNYVCTNGASGAFAMRRIEGGIDGLTGAIATLSTTGCSGTVVTIGAARVK